MDIHIKHGIFFQRGGVIDYGSKSGTFVFGRTVGSEGNCSFRVVLAGS